MTSPDPVWAAGKPRVVVLGPTEEKLTARLMEHLGGLFHPRWGFSDGWTPGSGSTDGEIHARLSTADLAVLVAGPGTPIDVMEALQARRPELLVVPVLARKFDTSMTPLGQIVCLPRSMPVASYSNEDEALALVAGEVKGICKGLQAKYAAPQPKPEPPKPADRVRDLLAEAERNFKAGVDPLSLVRSPPPYSIDAARGTDVTPDSEAFVEAVLSAFDRAALTQVLYYGLETNLADIVAPGGLRTQAFELYRWLVNVGRLDQFIREATSRNPGNPTLAAYAKRRGGVASKQSVDRNAVYDRLSRLLPAQLSMVAVKLGMPHAFLPGPTASTSDHAIAIIRWAEQANQMQRLLDAEANAQRAYR